ncbi:MAG: DUF1857 family protein [Aquabacterium sp.]
MRFEHLIEINSASAAVRGMTATFTREQLWLGLMIRLQSPQRFPNGPERCEWAQPQPGLYERTLYFGQHGLRDRVQVTDGERMVFTPEPHGELSPIRLTVSIEEPQPGQMVLRFIYEALAEQTAEEAYYNEYRHNAWLHHDRDMVRTLREWLEAGQLERLSH